MSFLPSSQSATCLFSPTCLFRALPLGSTIIFSNGINFFSTRTTKPNRLTLLNKLSIHQFLNSNPKYESSQLYHLATQLQCSPSSVQKYITNTWRLRGTLTGKQKETLRAWLRKRSYHELNEDHLARLEHHTMLSPSKIRKSLYAMHFRAERRRSFSNEERTTLRDWIQRHSYNDLTQDVLDQLASQLGGRASPTRIRQFIYQCHKQASMNITKEDRAAVRQWLHERHINSPADLSSEDYNILHDSLNKKYSKKTIGNYIQQYMHASDKAVLSEEVRSWIFQWIEKNPNTIPSSKEMEALCALSGLPEHRLSSILHRTMRWKVQLSEKNKQQLRNWMQDHKYSDLTKEVVEQFSREMNVRGTKIRHYVYNSMRKARIKRMNSL
mmetsp:Transcript_4489/g.16967  ORF Transcript_4489/g.16967 Transcript_4489/m.16967 type:complete len:383 (-) Transcript_4489:910-2058(-)